ncbi:hypothetical protein [Amycolatopsis australiensis]|uniref:Uncharacterized protein n=1 Tax=Amycolatopsis australiensis TaxID=546364 RepID=A0A1K1Q1C8_9PSEU|nr:hypothetical protein [Amycolatopsis australiensis]SFW53688.1 hypothetical protein SAMN04489730_1254 [Amycolatopsis australiensis]
MAFQTPMFFKYYAQTYRVDSTPDGGLMGTILDLDTGFFREDNSHIREVIWSTTESDIQGPFSEDRFVQETERERDYHLTGEGPIFALYETVGGLYAQARKRENRRLEPQEVALVQSIYKRTFKMWEDEAARRAAGEPPTFEARRKHPIRRAEQ